MAPFPSLSMTSTHARVLLVDDDRSFLDIITDTLREGGYSVDATSDPAEALRRAEAAPYDVALLDLVMPDMTGLELGDRIKAASPDTEVLILTGHADLDSAIQGIKHRVFDYLEKTNLDIARLDHVIKDATERSRLTRANRELKGRVEEMNRRLQALVDVSARLAAEPHQDRLLQTLVQALADVLALLPPQEGPVPATGPSGSPTAAAPQTALGGQPGAAANSTRPGTTGK